MCLYINIIINNELKNMTNNNSIRDNLRPVTPFWDSLNGILSKSTRVQNQPDQNQPKSKSTRLKSTQVKIHPIKINPVQNPPDQNSPSS